MPDFELFNGTNLEEPDADHRIAMNKPSLAGAFYVRWDAFKNLLRGFLVSKDTDQSISGNKTFTGVVNVQAPTSDNNPVTLKYFNDNAGGGGGTLTFETSFELDAYLTNPDRKAGQTATCLDLGYEDVILRLSNNTTAWEVIEATVYATQEQAIEGIETSVVMNPLRSAQQWVYNVLTRTFEELTTASKTIIGAINELKTSITNILIDLGLTATQNPGVCARCRIYPADIVVDPIAMTVSVVTVRNGQNISASCPLRFFTDGDGVIHKWEFYAPITASFTKINGIWGFYINQTGQVVCDQTPWSDFATVAPIYRFYLNDQLPNSEMIEPVCYEAHTTDTSASDHEWMHAQGTIHVSGFDHVSNQLTLDANGRPTTAPNADGRNTVIALTTGKSSDDGLAHTVTNSTDGAQFSQDLGNTTAASLNATNSALFRIRTNDAVGRLSFLPATRFPFPWNTVNNSPQFITTTGVRTDVTDNRWFVVFVYDFPDSVNGRAVKVVTAPQDFTTYSLAVAYQWESIQGAYATMRDKEIRPLYKDIYYCDKSGGGAYPAGCKYAAKCSTTDIRTLKPVQTSASSGSVLASNVICTPPTGYASTDQQSLDNELAANTLKGNTTVHATPVDADSVGIWDSVGSIFKRISLLSIYTFFVGKATPAQELSTLLDTDAIFGARGTDAKYWSFALFVQKLLGYIPKDSAYTAASWADVQAIVESATCPESVAIHLVADVQIGNLTTYAKNIIFHGRQCVLPDAASVSILGAGTTGAFLMTFESGINCAGTTGTISFGSATYIQTWDVRVRDLIGAPTTTQLSIVKVGSSTCTFKYNKATDIVFSVSNVAPVQSDMWYKATGEVIVYTNIVIGGTYAGPYIIASVPDNYYVDMIEITDVTLTAFSLIPKFETSTDTYTPIADSQARVAEKIKYIYNNRPVQTGLGSVNNTKMLGVYVLNLYGETRRLILADYIGGWINSTVNVKVVLKENK